MVGTRLRPNPVTKKNCQGLTYALNEPCKEMLYLPTSDAIKFKAKGWIDVFGSRCAKGVGSFVTLSTRGDRRRLATYGGVASFMIRLDVDLLFPGGRRGVLEVAIQQ